MKRVIKAASPNESLERKQSELFERMMDVLYESAKFRRRDPEEVNWLVYEAANEVVRNIPDLDVDDVDVHISSDIPRKSYIELQVGPAIVNINWRKGDFSIDFSEKSNFEPEDTDAPLDNFTELYERILAELRYSSSSQDLNLDTLAFAAANAVNAKYPEIDAENIDISIAGERDDIIELSIGDSFVVLDGWNNEVYVDEAPEELYR